MVRNKHKKHAGRAGKGEHTMIDWKKYYEDYAAERIQRKRELLEEERRKKEPNEFTIRRLEADIWVLQNS